MENRTNLFSFCLNVVATHVWTSNWSLQNFKVRCSRYRDVGVENSKDICIGTKQFPSL